MRKNRAVLIFLSLMVLLAVNGGSPAFAKDKGVLKFRMSSHYPQEETEFWVKKVEKATNGRVKIAVYANSSLLGLEDTMSGLKAGIADIAPVPCENFPEAFPLNNVLILPFLPMGDKETQRKVWHQLQDQFPEMAAEWSGFKVLADNNIEGNILHLVKSKVTAPEELKGLRLFANGPTSDIMEDLGAVPLYLEVPDWYTSLDRGLLEGMWLPWSAVYDLNIYPLLPYHVTFPSAPGMMMANILMRMEAWNNIPADIQKAILDVAPEQLARAWQNEDEKKAKTLEAIKNTGGTVIELSEEEVTKWYEAALPQHKVYLAKVDAMGLPATKVYNEALRLAKEYSK